MTKKTYIVTVFDDGLELIQYEENGRLYSIPKDEANSDYQRYLNPEAEQSTPSVTSGD
jgi:hypothetical protein